MEGFLLGVAVACFGLAGCSAVAAAIIFVKLNVAYAIRFLRHRPKSAVQRQRAGYSPSITNGGPCPEEEEEEDMPTCILPEEADSEEDTTGKVIREAQKGVFA